ncbi:MAG: LysR family transcriptional regulator [Rhodoferax sp.]|nr:LysR family transcriptional regulator [Rhodoferax sp.]
MDLLRSLEYFHKTVELGSFSGAANALGLTPAAVSKQIGELEKTLGTRVFQRSTRNLTLTETGEQLLAQTSGPTHALRQVIDGLVQHKAQPAGTLRISVAPGFARQYILPLMPAFLTRYPAINLDWSFDNRHVDLIKEGFDAAIGAGIASDSTVVARELVPLRLVTVASPAYLMRMGVPRALTDLDKHDCIRLRSATTGRLREWQYIVAGEVLSVPVTGRLVLSDLDAICDCALAGLGLARLGAHHAMTHLDAGRLVQVLPELRAPPGTIHVYYAHYRLTPPKVSAFVGYLTESLQASGLLERLQAY